MSGIKYKKYGPPTAYAFVAKAPEREDGKVYWRIRNWNCWGEPRVQPGYYYDTLLPKGYPKGLIDHRTLDMIKKGCCPPRLLKDFIMTESGELAERDPVLEAMKLHKRGYFGGGG